MLCQHSSGHSHLSTTGEAVRCTQRNRPAPQFLPSLIAVSRSPAAALCFHAGTYQWDDWAGETFPVAAPEPPKIAPPFCQPSPIDFMIPSCSRLPTHLAHPIQYERAVAVHALGTSLQGSWQNRGELCCGSPANIPGRGSVMITTR